MGTTALPAIYNIIELDSTLEVKRSLLQANNSFNSYDEVTTQFANTLLDRNGEYYLVRSQNDLDVGGACLPDYEDGADRNLFDGMIAVYAVGRAAGLPRRRHGAAVQQGVAFAVAALRRFVGCMHLRRQGAGR